MMYSPRSVSTGVMPLASRCSLMAISSPIMVLPLVTVRAPTRRQMASTAARGAPAPRAVGEQGGAGRLGIGAPMHLAPARLDIVGEALEIEIEIGERVILDSLRGGAQGLELRHALHRRGAPGDEGIVHPGQRLLQIGIAQRQLRLVVELEGRRSQHPFDPSPMAGPSVMPASTSATWRAFTLAPRRPSLPAMFRRQPRSPASSVPAPVFSISSAFS